MGPGLHWADTIKSGVMLLNLTDHPCIKLVFKLTVNSLDFTGSFIVTFFFFFLKKGMQDLALCVTINFVSFKRITIY